ncbi:MAG: DsbA family protein [Fimbriimonadaceae bacterium]|nr:DsbA family protein [Fimbriimonadaceae bacterium]
MVVKIAHDFTCPWCWIGLSQANRLREEFGTEIVWAGYELWPENLDRPSVKPPALKDERRPATPSRLELAYAAEGMAPPTAERPKLMRTHNALQAAEFAREAGAQHQAVEAIYRALWEEGDRIGDLDVLRRVLAGILDVDAMAAAVETRRFAARIVAFDNDAYSVGVFNVPTFFIGGERYAEQPYVVLHRAVRQVLAPV